MRLICLQLEASCLQWSFLLTVDNSSFSTHIWSSSAYNFSFCAYSGKMRRIQALRDCKQRSSTVSKKAPTVSKKASPLIISAMQMLVLCLHHLSPLAECEKQFVVCWCATCMWHECRVVILTPGISSKNPQKGPAERGHVKKRQKSSKSVKNIFDTFRQFSRRAKNVKNRQKVSKYFSTFFDIFRAAPVFRPFLGGSENFKQEPAIMLGWGFPAKQPGSGRTRQIERISRTLSSMSQFSSLLIRVESAFSGLCPLAKPQ